MIQSFRNLNQILKLQFQQSKHAILAIKICNFSDKEYQKLLFQQPKPTILLIKYRNVQF